MKRYTRIPKIDAKTRRTLKRAARQFGVSYSEVARAALFIYAANHRRMERERTRTGA